MRTVDVDARRYVWCRGHALWIMGLPAQGFVEDLRGAEPAGQDGLVRYAARMLGEACAVALALTLRHSRPIPSPRVRSAWALERLEGHELWQPCWELIRGFEDEPAKAIAVRAESLFAATGKIVGEIPEVLTPEGYYPALAMARDWLKVMSHIDEEGFLPDSWTSPI